MAEYTKAPQVAEVARRLIEEYHPHLREAKIEYLFRDGDWSTQHRETWGRAAKVSGQWAYLTGYDFVITIQKQVWYQLDEADREALLDHELSHCCRGEDTPSGEPTWYIQGHDFEDFVDVVRRRGLWRPELRKIPEAIEEHEQLALFSDETELVGESEGEGPGDAIVVNSTVADFTAKLKKRMGEVAANEA